MEVMVSVYCLVYNHEKYLRKTLEGFVNQKTNFSYEVIIHDDASTDGSADIIREYCEKYPNIFIPIYQTENQYSKGGGIFVKFIKPNCRGKYMAICEGDDYWCDDNKLQMQVEYLESHPECSMCVHDTQMVNHEGELLKDYVNGSKKDRDYEMNSLIRADGGGLFQTSSVLARSFVIKEKPENMKIRGIGDYSTAINAGANGYVHYFGRVMSCYRVGHGNSWVTRLRKDKSILKKQYEAEYNDITRIDEVLGKKYTKAFEIARGQRLCVLYRKVYGFGAIFKKPSHMWLVMKAIIYRFYYKISHRIRVKLY